LTLIDLNRIFEYLIFLIPRALALSNKSNKLTLLSGIKPTGLLHIGHYIGAIQHWVALQDDYHCLFPITDLHAITTHQNPETLRCQSYDILSLYIACGIHPEKNILFIQSHVSEHCELAWILNCFTQVGELNRMTQFKDKAQKQPKNINAGLYSYPVLMAADILLYGAHLVPVGSDQKQHLELARNIALRFNHHYGDILTLPEPYIAPTGERIMGLQNPQKKMSKTDDNIGNYISLLDSPDQIRKKIKRAVTDSNSEIAYDKNRHGIANLLTLYSAATDTPIESLVQRYEGKGYGVFKQELAEALITLLVPIQVKFKDIRQDTAYLNAQLQQGAERARLKAQARLKQIRKSIGFITL